MGKRIRRFFVVLLYLVIFSSCEEVFSQTNYIMDVENGIKINDNTIEFDVFIKSTGSNFTLTSYQCSLLLSPSIINNGRVNFSYIAGTSQFSNIPPTVSIGTISNLGSYVLTFASLPGQETITTFNKKVGRFRVSNSNSFSGTGFNIWWCFEGNLTTILTGSGFVNITNRYNHIHLSGQSVFPATVSVNDGWNLISIPGYHPVNQNVNTWWVNRDPNTSVYNVNYQSVTTLETGTGYWLKHNGNQIYNTGEEWPSTGIYYSPNYPISGKAGWNSIGIYNYDISAAAITTTPPGLQSGFVYGFNNNAGYIATNILTPGHGYLIYLSNPGYINLPDSGYSGLPKSNDLINENWGRIIISDKAGKSYTLYGVKGEEDVKTYLLPPVLLPEVFDVRFSTNKILEDLAEEKTIQISGAEYPIKICIKGMDLKLRDEATGETINKELKDGEDVLIENSSLDKLIVQSNEIKTFIYELSQNYPNPFNPSTTIKFKLAKDGFVTIKIYDILGNEVTTLINEFRKQGSYQTNFNASSIASGVYFYKLQTGEFVESKKMILIK